MAQPLQPSGEVGRQTNLVPIGLKEAAIDSPTSRATVVHYGEQVDLVEKWLEEYMKATNRLVSESLTLENVLNGFTSHGVIPTTISESMLDHDYSVLAMKKYSEGAKDYWMSMMTVVKRLSALVSEPIRQFLQTDLRNFKDARRLVETSQKTFDNLQSKYAGLGKSKEPSSLREDAFQLHEARKVYLRATMEFFSMAPQFRFALDKLLIRIFSDQWREMRASRDNSAASFQRGAGDMDRIKAWVQEMEGSEKTFRKELVAARKQLEDAAELSARPSRELDDYSVSTVPQFGTHAHTTSGSTVHRSPKKAAMKTAEKQGWLFLRTYTGKPTRTAWVKRWAFVRNGVFGWLVQATRPGGVEESEQIGVLLCNVRPAPAEERRFCFELKTNKNTIVLQAETQSELVEWIGAFEAAKSRAVEDPGATGRLPSVGYSQAGPAFSITAPLVPEFGTYVLGLTEPGAAGEDATGPDRTNTLPVPGSEHLREGSMDLPRRSTGADEAGHRETASRIISKLDLTRKSGSFPQGSSNPSTQNLTGGIASLIAASHGSMPVGPSIPFIPPLESESAKPRNSFILATRDMPPSSLAPSTLVAVPAPTSLSKSAVVVTGERGLSAAVDKGGIPTSLLANTWGASHATVVSRFDRDGEGKVVLEEKSEPKPSPRLLPLSSPSKRSSPVRGEEIPHHNSISQLDLNVPQSFTRSRTPSPGKRHRSTISIDRDVTQRFRGDLAIPDFPHSYPLQLKSQDAQFRLLFPNVRQDERLVMVFRATCNPANQQECPGRVYVTPHDLYFYSNHLGLVCRSCVPLASIDEATAAPGRECDFLFLHLKEGGVDGSAKRITLKTFLEPLKLLQRRLNLVIRNSVAKEPLPLDELIKALLTLESDTRDRSPSLESWEDVSPNTPVDTGGPKYRGRALTVGTEFKPHFSADRRSHPGSSAPGETAAKFKLPAQPVRYTPPGNLKLAVEKEFDISPKALFHVMFGDKSALWQLLQHGRCARNLKQCPWTRIGEGRLRRDFEFEVSSTNIFGQERITKVQDYQVIDVNNDHLCYVITDRRTPWHLPFPESHRLVSKIVITHVAKAKCKLAVFVKVEWLRDVWLARGMIERQDLNDLELDSLDLVDLVADQVQKLGAHSRTKKAVQIFGPVGRSTETTELQIDASALNMEMKRTLLPKTMASLLQENAFSAAQSVAVAALEIFLDVLKWTWKTISANKMILLFLVLSTLYNSWHTYRDAFDWWHERNAAKFMARMGVSPNAVMSKAVYVRDLDEILSRDGHLPRRDSSPCYAVFHDELDPDTVYTGGNSAVQRAQQTRQRLGTYRHDLLVAMRVVNGIERELMQSEWERWVVEENRRCQFVEGMMDLNATGPSATETAIDRQSGPDHGTETDAPAELSDWCHEYCQSCQDEYMKLRAASEAGR